MKNWPTAAMVIVLMAVIVGLPVVMSGSGSRPAPTPVGDSGPATKLIVITPHNQQIRFEFERAFNRWRVEHGKSPVIFDWRSGGGTSDLQRIVFDQFTVKIRNRREDDGIGCDLFFGGGDYVHNKLATSIPVDRDGQKTEIYVTVPARVPPLLFEQAYPTATIGSEPLYHPQKRWLGVALASFGIVYNRDTLRMLGLDDPEQWTDLRDSRYLRWIALADPAHSGAITQTYNTILRREGWDEGWRVLRRVFANSRYFSAGSGKVPVDVSAGEAAAGMCIDFYGRYQAGAVGGDRIGYIDPPFNTAITADPISILRGAPHEALAHEFVGWLLTPAAQHLWQKRINTPGGPSRFELRRLPIRADVYRSDDRRYWTDDTAPFAIAKPYPIGTPNYYGAVSPVAHALAIDIHSDLVAAWRAIVNERDPRKKIKMERAFDRMPAELCLPWPDDELARNWRQAVEDEHHARHHQAVAILKQFNDSLGRLARGDSFVEVRLKWTRAFQEQYRQVQKIARQK